MDINNLSLTDANKLIQNQKEPKSILEYNGVYNQVANTLIHTSSTYKCQIIDKNEKIEYCFSTHTTPLPTNFSIGLRIEKNNIHLIRFDFGENLRHKNNFGQKNEYVITGPHVHILSSSNKRVPKNVIKVDNINSFKNLKIINDVFQQFISYTNIK